MSSGQPGASVLSRETAPDPFRPSEYTGLLVHTLRSRARDFGRGLGLDMGMGSGVLLATLGALGMQRLYGVDIDPAAIGASRSVRRFASRRAPCAPVICCQSAGQGFTL